MIVASVKKILFSRETENDEIPRELRNSREKRALGTPLKARKGCWEIGGEMLGRRVGKGGDGSKY